EPLLRKDFNQTCLQVEDEESKCWIIIRHCSITGWHNQFVNRTKLARHIDLVCSSAERQRDFKIRGWSGCRVNSLGGLLEPAGHLGHLECLQLIRIKAGESQTASFWTPDAKEVRRHKERPAIGIEREPHSIRLLLKSQRDQMCNRTLRPVMSPCEL